MERSEAHLPFNFQLINTPWGAAYVRQVVDEYEASVPKECWPNGVLGNHDQRRIASRVGARQARVAAVLLLTLRGTPTLCYGDEIGMMDIAVEPGQAMDPRERPLRRIQLPFSLAAASRRLAQPERGDRAGRSAFAAFSL